MFLESVNYLTVENFTCVGNNNNDYSRNNPQEFGSCFDLKNAHNISFNNIVISSCFSQVTAPGQKITFEKDKGGSNNHVKYKTFHLFFNKKNRLILQMPTI